jgi:hypothetical protein
MAARPEGAGMSAPSIGWITNPLADGSHQYKPLKPENRQWETVSELRCTDREFAGVDAFA